MVTVARVEVVKIVVDSGPLFRGHGIVKRWMDGIQFEMTSFSRIFAPRRTGALAAGIGGSVATTTPRRVEAVTTSKAPYTPFVVYGTHGPIMSNKAFATGGRGAFKTVPGKFGPMKQGVPGMFLKLSPGAGFPTLYKTQVSGQSANNFFFRAYVATRANHRSLPARRPATR